MELGKRNQRRMQDIRSHCRTIIWLTELAEDPERTPAQLQDLLSEALDRLPTIRQQINHVRDSPQEGLREPRNRG